VIPSFFWEGSIKEDYREIDVLNDQINEFPKSIIAWILFFIYTKKDYDNKKIKKLTGPPPSLFV